MQRRYYHDDYDETDDESEDDDDTESNKPEYKHIKGMIEEMELMIKRYNNSIKKEIEKDKLHCIYPMENPEIIHKRYVLYSTHSILHSKKKKVT